MAVSIRGRIPTIPEYYHDLIDSSVDLTSYPKQCCPFHNEDTPSFSYSAERGVWRCFGGCHAGGDVYELHKRNYRLKTRDEAIKSLKNIYGVTEKINVQDSPRVLNVNASRVEDNAVYIEALQLANNVDRWLELDYVMSQTPVETYMLQELLDKWKAST